jgi:two-component system nitrogen regulation sensor histidine kinase GlnL
MSNKLNHESADSTRLLQALSTAILVTDGQLVVTTVNAAAEALLALSSSKIISRKLHDVLIDPPELIELVKRTLSDSQSFTKRDFKLTPMSLHSNVVDCTVSPWVSNIDGQLNVLIEFASVERHQRIQLEENMVLQNQVTNELMRGIAHEVKNPLGGIRGAAQLLERELEDKRQAEYTQIIIGEADRLHGLVDAMIGSQTLLEKRNVNIHEVLERVRRLVEAEHTGTVQIERDYDPSLPEFEGDRNQLIQAFLNLVRNAVRAVQHSDATITIRSRAQRKFTIRDQVHRSVMRIDVIDTGPGVAPEIADRIFFPMVTGHADGTGLGLPLAQSIINRQGGLIGFSSEPGNTNFSTWLPIEGGK